MRIVLDEIKEKAHCKLLPAICSERSLDAQHPIVLQLYYATSKEIYQHFQQKARKFTFGSEA